MTETQAVQNAEQPSAEHAPTALTGIPATRAPRTRRDASRTRSEARLAFRTPLAGGEDGVDDRRFSVLDVTSGLPDDSRESDERVRSRISRQKQGRVAAAMEALHSDLPPSVKTSRKTPCPSASSQDGGPFGAHPEARVKVRDVVYHDQTRLRMFCGRFGITPNDICPRSDESTDRCSWCRGRHGRFQPIAVEDVFEVLASPFDWIAEVRAREAACLPEPEG